MLKILMPVGILCLVGIVVAFSLITYVMRRRGKNVPLSLIYGVSMCAIAIFIATCHNVTDKNAWAKVSFEGRIIEKRITDEHALVQFVIQEQDATECVILDKFWKMDGFKIGDHVIKKSGSMNVVKQLVAPR